MIAAACVLIAAYLVGSVPSGYLIAKMVKRIDICKHGSGNMGATNVFRILGPAWGVLVLGMDIAKGYLVVAVLAPLFYSGPAGASELIFKLAVGFAAIAGHNWTVFLRFKGGKGVATSCGVFLAIVPKAVLAALVIWISTVVLTKYISVGSMAAAASCPVWVWVFYRRADDFRSLMTVALFVTALIIFTHRANIKRLRDGKEFKITDSSKRL